MDLVFATNNQNKLKEIKQLLDNSINILSLNDIGCFDDIPETGNTLEENALQKALYVYEKYGKNLSETARRKFVELYGEEELFEILL